jgi:LmbE family N-acetylglucosaminyl deacetylase
MITTASVARLAYTDFKLAAILFLFVFSALLCEAQAPLRHPTGDIYQRLHKLNTVGSVLYLAAHPDDENTQLIAYCSNELHLRTGYLSATRGGGGQNLIGTEIQEGLGIIRTQELLAARNLDGGEQFFSRAIDFGFSKNPDETFSKWDKQMILADFVWVIRKFRPDVMVTRFNLEPGTTHGQHTASAVLALEAFKLSGDSTAFPEQLKYVKTWQPTRIFWNASAFFYKNPEELKSDKFIKLDIGKYNPYFGKSYNEIAAESRSMHKSQGFGRAGTRGETFEYLQQWGGAKTSGLFDGINTTWSRLADGKQVNKYVQQALHEFNPANPSAIVPLLLRARTEILKLKDPYWKETKLKEVNELILAVTGTFIEFTAKRESYSPSDSIAIKLEAVNRSRTPIELAGVSFSRWKDTYVVNKRLAENAPYTFQYKQLLGADVANSNPYWLAQDWKEGMYDVKDQLLIGLSQNKAEITAKVSLKVMDQTIDVEMPVVYKESDRVRGEVYSPVVLGSDVMINIEQKALVFPDQAGRDIKVTLVAGQDNVSGRLVPKTSPGWKAAPDHYDFKLNQKSEEQDFIFQLTPPEGASTGTMGATAIVDGKELSRGILVINYEHIPRQTWFPKAETRVVHVDLKRKGQRIGYVMGAGDEVPNSIQQMGYQVDMLQKNDLEPSNLSKYDAVIVGVRAFNTIDWLAYKNQALFEYSKNGGVVIVQYNTPGTVTERLAPYSLTLSGSRVTVEDSEVRILAPEHPVLNTPNKIVKEDFAGWIQERGLYFPGKWGPEFEPIVSCNDPGESPLNSSLLVARHGKGYYIYTGISFFRQLPAGVPGAYRLFANMISLGAEQHARP